MTWVHRGSAAVHALTFKNRNGAFDVYKCPECSRSPVFMLHRERSEWLSFTIEKVPS